MDRCRDVMWALHRFGVHLIDSVMARAALVSDEGEVPPEWVLHVGAVTDAQVSCAVRHAAVVMHSALLLITTPAS